MSWMSELDRALAQLRATAAGRRTYPRLVARRRTALRYQSKRNAITWRREFRRQFGRNPR